MKFDATVAQATLASALKFPPAQRYLEQCVGGLSKPSKMPWLGYSIPASECKTGSVLRQLSGSVCSDCYACKGRYCFDTVQHALQKRHAIIMDDLPRWAGYMVALLLGKASRVETSRRYFRWHDSGDVQSKAHIMAIVWIAQQLPQVRFWLPTKEQAMFRDEEVRAAVEAAPNLTVRVSAPMIGQTLDPNNWPTSSVDAFGPAPLYAFKCPASEQENKCGDCRACWDKRVINVDYPQH